MSKASLGLMGVRRVAVWVLGPVAVSVVFPKPSALQGLRDKAKEGGHGHKGNSSKWALSGPGFRLGCVSLECSPLILTVPH